MGEGGDSSEYFRSECFITYNWWWNFRSGVSNEWFPNFSCVSSSGISSWHEFVFSSKKETQHEIRRKIIRCFTGLIGKIRGEYFFEKA